MHIKYRVISFVVMLAILLSPISTAQTAFAQNQAVECGTWSIKPASQKPKDSWIEIVLVSSATTDDCSANFRIINKTGIETGIWDTDIGGYSFELTAIVGSSVTSWTEPWKSRGLAFLSPSLDAGMIATPLSKSSEAIITVHGDVTINSFAFDMALFVLGSVLTNAAGKTCLLSIPEDQITLMAIRIYGILNTAANLTFSGDIAGALDELKLVFDEVLGRIKDGATDVGAECAVKGLVKLSPFKKSEILAQIVFDFIVWDGKLIWDLIKLPGSPTVLLVYTPAIPAPASTPTPISYELPPLDKQDYYSVLQWVKYAMANNDMSVFEELVKGDLGQPWITWIGKTENVITRTVFLNDLATRLPSKPYCDRYSQQGDWMAIWTGRWSPNWEVKEICRPNCVKLDPSAALPAAYSDSLNFTLHNGTDGWEIVEANIWSFDETTKAYYGQLGWDYRFAEVTSCDEVPLPSTVVAVSTSSEPPPLEKNDYYSVLQWIKYAFANNYIDVFKELVTDDLAYVSYIEGGDPVTRSEFLDDLATRLPSGPHCDSFAIYSDSYGDRLDVWSTGWSPKWVMDQLCYGGCSQLNPPTTTDVIAFSLLNEGSGWHIAAVPFGERPSWWVDTYHYQIISCDTVQFSPILASTQISSAIPPLNQAEYFSVLQWIKYAALNNEISVFEQLIVGNSIQLIDGSNAAVNINKADFLSELSTRLTSKPNCEFFMFEESGRLVIRISNWSPGWGVDGNTIVYLILEMKNNQWVLTSIIYGDYLPSWAAGLERISFDTISLSVGSTVETACKEARPTRLKDGDFAFVSFYPPLLQRVRSSYGLANEIIARLPTGTAVKIIDGPECADNFLWWKIKVLNSGLQGWTAEADKDAYWLIPCESRKNCGTQ